MICRDCALIADLNVERRKEGKDPYEHHINCNCDCQHKVGAWKDFIDETRLREKRS